VELAVRPLLLASVGFNFACGSLLSRNRSRPVASRALLAGGITANLLLLSYYKYADFFIVNWNLAFHAHVDPLHLILPLGISFFALTQIAFLVDSYKGIATEPRYSHYLLFVTYFPHLIAGPVLHQREMMPQFGSDSTYKFSWHDVAVGTAIFAVGLFQEDGARRRHCAARGWRIHGRCTGRCTAHAAGMGGPCWPTHCSCTSTSPATPTCRSGCRECLA
jgi:D-alanyl-lipoteichoic acid acyltransferase DltB (MBOAT superfamily)